MKKPPVPKGIAGSDSPLLRPSEAALARAQPLFAKMMAAPVPAAGAPAKPLFAQALGHIEAHDASVAASWGSPSVSAVRRYPQLRALLQWPEHAPMHLPPHAPPAAAATQIPAQAAHVRRAISRPAPAPDVPDDLLAQTATAALFWQPEAGVQSFDIAIDDALFADMRCRISLSADGVDALFVVADAHSRWLLEGEAGRLRDLLLARGLKVRSIRVLPSDAAEATLLLR